MIGSSWTRRDFVAGAATSALLSFGQHAGVKLDAPPQAYFGTTSRGGSKGIYRSSWNPQKGELGAFELAAEAKDSGFLLACPAQSGRPPMIYGVSETLGVQGGIVYAFRKEADGSLVAMGTQPSGGEHGVHMATDRTGRMLMVANFDSGSLNSFIRNQDGGLSAAVEHFQYRGHGPNAERQAGPHTHGVLVSPDNRFALINDLGQDKIFVYHLHPATAKLTPNDPPAFKMRPESGPRHSIFHPNGRWVYSINEIDCTVELLRWNAARGVLTRGSSAKILPEGHEAGRPPAGAPTAGDSAPPAARGNSAAEVCITADGRFVYATNRGEFDCVTTFAVHPATGELTGIQYSQSGGRTARHVCVDATGRWIFVCCSSGQVFIFERDTQSGKLTAHQSYPLSGAASTILI